MAKFTYLKKYFVDLQTSRIKGRINLVGAVKIANDQFDAKSHVNHVIFRQMTCFWCLKEEFHLLKTSPTWNAL